MFEGVKIFLNDSWSWELISPVCWFWCCVKEYCIRKNLLRVRYGKKRVVEEKGVPREWHYIWVLASTQNRISSKKSKPV